MVEITNYNARISGTILGLGKSTKKSSNHLAGQFGEGFNLACLTLARTDYNVRVQTSSQNWRMEIKPEGHKYEHVLCCHITGIKDEQILKAKNAATKVAERGKPPQKGRPWCDVTVKIGGGKRRKVTEQQFREWMKQSLELHPPSKLIETPNGSLILDPEFENKVFLKGILLERFSDNLRSFKHGYNYANGRTNRDRQVMSVAEEQGHILSQIWAHALMQDGHNFMDKYFTMLQDDKEWEDVEYAEDMMTLPTAKLLRQHLKKEDPMNVKFYFYADNADKASFPSPQPLC